jgi:hypothetical protein
MPTRHGVADPDFALRTDDVPSRDQPARRPLGGNGISLVTFVGRAMELLKEKK